MIHGSLFTGSCGGFDLAAEWMGWQNTFQVEILPEARQRLAQNFPHATQYDDVRTFNGLAYRNQIDVLTGGFPCQDLSSGNQHGATGLDGARSSLWFEYERIIGEVRPGYVVIENSPMLLVRGVERVLAGLARLGYDAKWAVVSAARYGAPSPRKRLYILAYPHHQRRAALPHWPECLTENEWRPDQHRDRPRGWDTPSEVGYEAWRPLVTRFRGLDDGLPIELAQAELRGYGNAIIPHCAYEIFQAIEAATHSSPLSPY